MNQPKFSFQYKTSHWEKSAENLIKVKQDKDNEDKRKEWKKGPEPSDLESILGQIFNYFMKITEKGVIYPKLYPNSYFYLKNSRTLISYKNE